MTGLLYQGQKRKGFLYSELYLWLLTAMVVSSWYFGQMIIGFIAMAFVFVMVMCLHDDATPALPIVCMLTFIIPSHAAQDPGAFIDQNFILLAILAGVVIGSVILFFIINRQKFNFGKQFIGLAVGAVAFLCSGLLYDINAWKASVPSIAMYVLAIFLVYLLCVNGVRRDVPKQYFAKIFMHVGIVMVIQTIIFYATSELPFATLIETKALDLGWGISNNIGAVLLFTMPLTLYLAVKEDRTALHTFYYMFMFTLQVLTLVVSLSRGAMVGAIIGVPVSMVYACIIAKKKTKLFVSFGIILVAVVGLVIWQWDHVCLIFNEYAIIGGGSSGGGTGGDIIQDSGRFGLYLDALRDFLKSPLFGLSPFHTIDPMAGEFTPLWYHCTPLQILANAGIFGMIGYILHVFSKYRVLCTKNSNKINRFILFSVIMWSIHGLLDPCYSILNQLLLFVIILSFAETSLPKDFKVFGRNFKKL